MKRAAAVLAAVAFVALGFVVRGRGTDGSSDGGSSTAAALRCDAGLAEVCRAAGIGAFVDDAGTVADGAIDAVRPDELDAAGWIVPRPWADAVVAERARLGGEPLFEVSEPIASTTVAIAIWADVVDSLRASCAAIDWACLADAAARGGSDPLRIGMPSVDAHDGLPVAVSQAVGLLGRVGIAANDFDGTFRTRAGTLAAGTTDDPLGRMRSRGPGELDAVGVLAADIGSLTSTFGTISVVAPAPSVTIDLVVLVPTGTRLPSDRLSELLEQLVAAGWQRPATTRVDGPGGGVTAAIRTLWGDGD